MKKYDISGYYISMKTIENKLNISNIFEIRLRIEHWNIIVRLAQKHKISFSWATRMCIFQLLDQYENMIDEIDVVNLVEKEKLKESKKNNEKLHRHMVCTYGDEIRMRFVAHKLGLTLTQLVRISIILFSRSFLGYISRESLVRIGIKYVATVMEKLNSYIKINFLDEDYRPFRECSDGRMLFLRLLD